MISDLEKVEIACRRARERLGPLEFDERRVLSVLIDALAEVGRDGVEIRLEERGS